MPAPPTQILNIDNGMGPTPTQGVAWSWWAGGVQTNGAEYRAVSGAAVADTYPFTLDALFLPNNPNAYTNASGQTPKLQSFQLGAGFYVRRDADWLLDPSPTDGSGTAVGADGVVGGMAGVVLSQWAAGTSSAPSGVAGATVPALTGADTPLGVMQAVFRSAISPLLTSAFQIAANWVDSGVAFTAQANNAGVIKSGGAPANAAAFGSLGAFGTVDYEMGVCHVVFGRQAGADHIGDADVIDITDLGVPGVTHVRPYRVQADTLRYNAVGYSYLPLDAGIVGLDPVRLPADGRVPIFRPGSVCVVGHTQTSAPFAAANAQVYDAHRVRLARLRVVDAAGHVVNTGYTADLEAGTVTFNDVSGYQQPVRVEDRIEDMVLCSGAQISGDLTFTRPLTHAYPTPGSYVSSALIAGDLNARVSLLFDQASWNGTWSDAIVGSPATPTYNTVLAPLVVTNAGAVTERWVVRFTGTTAFEVIGEHVGVIATGNTSTATAPINPAAGEPYFSIAAIGWGAGWAVGNVVRFNTVGAEFPVWVARTVLQGPETVVDDAFTLLIRGDVDAPPP